MTTENTEIPTIPDDLQAKIESLKALATTHKLLSEASFKPNALQALPPTFAFIEHLHKQMLDDALAHPQANLSTELKPHMEGKTDGTSAN